jgi:hypothetical protein
MEHPVKISVFQNCWDPQPKNEIPLLRWLEGYPALNSHVDKIRQEPVKKLRDKMKIQLPAITASGLFKYREDTGLIKHSGFIAIDIDKISNPEQVKAILHNIKQVFYAGLSVSGRGVWALIPLKYPERHREHFKALEQDFTKLNITLDTNCINVSRLRVYSYDPNPVINFDATLYSRLQSEVKEKKCITPVCNNTNVNTPLEMLIAKIEATKIDITEPYNDWFKIGGALANVFGENGRDNFHRISQFHHGYDYDECNIQYDKCLKFKINYSENMIFSIAASKNVYLKQR